MPMSSKETRRKLDELTASFISGAITDLVIAKQEKNWDYVTKALNSLYATRDTLLDT